jgi:23S rRNA (cytosine1962-C5)-methyltransferase
MVTAEPLTGRTHQIRVHAAESGFPILGDTLYGGTAAARVYLHAGEIAFKHPVTGAPVKLVAPVDFDQEPRLALRRAILEPTDTNAFRLIHGASDGWPGWQVEKLGDFLLSQSETQLNDPQNSELTRLAKIFGAHGAYHKILSRQVRRTTTAEASPQLVWGEPAPERFEIRENGIRFEMSFHEGYSVGLFLDQRDNRRRFLTGQVAAGFPLHGEPASRLPQTSAKDVSKTNGDRRDACPTMLNTFAYTCGFSVCAAKAGWQTTSLDLSKKYLEWGKRNFARNGLASETHDFIYGDTFDWLRRLAKKGRSFDAIVLDPPTFSQSRESGVFRVEKDYGKLVSAALPVLKPGGILLASTNAADWAPEKFLASVTAAARDARRKIVNQHYVPQPPDFPVSRAEPAYLKTVWLALH